MFSFPADCDLVFLWETLHTLSKCLRGVSSPPFPKHTNNTAPIHNLGREFAWTASSEETLGVYWNSGEIPSLSRGPRTLKQNGSTQGHLVSENRVQSGKWLSGKIPAMNLGRANVAPFLRWISHRGTGDHTQGWTLWMSSTPNTDIVGIWDSSVVFFSSQFNLSFCRFQGNDMKAKQTENFCQYLRVCTFTVTNWRISTAIWFVRNALLICTFA